MALFSAEGMAAVALIPGASIGFRHVWDLRMRSAPDISYLTKLSSQSNGKHEPNPPLRFLCLSLLPRKRLDGLLRFTGGCALDFWDYIVNEDTEHRDPLGWSMLNPTFKETEYSILRPPTHA